jgi:formamidopyrimidine-DNA glycosylase
MPELPDIVLYLHALEPRIVGQPLERVRLGSPFLLRTVSPSLDAFEGRVVCGVGRIGKRIVWRFDEDRFLVFHLMIAGRLRWKPAGTRLPGKVGLAAFDFPEGTLILTEAGTKRRASLHAIEGLRALRALDPGGVEVLEATVDEFDEALQQENHTLKRALTDPRILSGIGNAYSDEILHAARLSPFRQTQQLAREEVERLHAATQQVLRTWIDALQRETGGAFPDRVTAFKPGMAVHGRYGQPCPACGTPVQRIVYAENEANYCPTCQTGGRLLADRSLSRLLHEDWPRTLDELENRKRAARVEPSRGPGDESG